MKTLTLLGCITCVAGALAACGTDPVILGEILDSASDGSSEPPQSDEPEPPSPPDEDTPASDDPPPEEAPYPAPGEEEPVSPIEAEVMDILLVNCGDCHSGVAAAGDLGYIDDLDQLIENDMIVPGNKEDSRLYERMVNQTMPPAFERAQRPTLSQIELIGYFIDELE